MQYSNIGKLQDQYDYVIIGGGSAGCLIASRLAENPKHTILILEAGSSYTPEWLLDIPALGVLLQQSIYDWGYETVPQTHACYAMNNNKCKWPLGRIVGGTSMFNNMIYLKGLKSDYDEWYKDNQDYNYKYDIEWYFNKSITFNQMSSDDSSFNDKAKLKKSILSVQEIRYSTPLSEYILNGVEELGYKILNINKNNDKNGKGYFMKTQVNQNEYGERWTTAHHLKTNILNKNNNVLLLTNAHVIKILFNNATTYSQPYEAAGVQFEHFNKIHQVYAAKEVILSAGVVHSPQILMLSGIGKKSDLEKVDIASWNDLPVGYNLQDHITTGFDLISINQTMFDLSDLLSPINLFNYLFNINNGGPFTTPACEVVGYIKLNNTNSTNNSPELGIMILPMGINMDHGLKLRHLLNIKNDMWHSYFNKLNNFNTITILPILLHPKSTGYIKLKSSNYKIAPLINPKFLTNPSDVQILLKGFTFIKQLIQTKSMQQLNATLLLNITIPDCINNNTIDYLECYIRYLTLTTYHPVGTCSIGHVVNNEFKVLNTNKLRVIDGSVVPLLPSTNVHSTIIMLAEQSIDFIKKTDYQTQYKNKTYLYDFFLYKIIYSFNYKCF